MALSDPIRKIIQAVLDVASFRKMETEAQRALDKGTDPAKAKKNLSAVERAMEGLKGTALKVGVALGGLFALDKLKDFALESLRAAAESTENWGRLDATLTNIGVNAEQQRPRLEALADAFQQTTRFDDDAFAQAFQTLIRVTGDYEGSLRNVKLAADLAIGANLDLNTAAQLLGRALNGDVSMLKRYGIEVRAGADVTEQLRARIGGLAEKDAATLGGRIAQLSNAWDDFKKSIGFALADASGGTSILQKLIGVVQGLTGFVQENAESLGVMATAIGGAANLGLFFWHLLEDVGDALGITFLTAVHGVTGALSLLASGQALATEAVAGFLRLIGASDTADKMDAFAETIRQKADVLRGVSDRADENRRRAGGDILRRHGVIPAAPPAPAPPAAPAASATGGGAETPQQRRQRLEQEATELEQLAKGLQLRSLTAQETRRLAQVERELRAAMKDGTLELETRNKIGEQLRALDEARTKSGEALAKSLDDEISALAELADLGRLNAADLDRARTLEARLSAQLERGNLTRAQRIKLEKERLQLEELLAAQERRPAVQQTMPSTVQRPSTPQISGHAVGAVNIPGFGVNEAQSQMDAWLQIHEKAFAELEQVAESFASGFQDAVEQAFSHLGGRTEMEKIQLVETLNQIGLAQKQLQDQFSKGLITEDTFKRETRKLQLLKKEAEDYAGFLETLARGVASSFVAGIAQMASQKSGENTAFAIEEVAKGFAALANPFLAWSAPLHFKSAAEHGIAALAWAALGGAAGAAAHGIAGQQGGGGAGGLSAGTQPVGRGIDNAKPSGPDVKIVLMGDFDALNPRVQSVIYKGHQYAVERFGENANIIDIRPGAG